jgi:hypothetical protein
MFVLLLLAAAGCTMSARPWPLQAALEGRCFASTRRSWSVDPHLAPRPRTVRLTGRRGELEGAPVPWYVAEPALGRRYTRWRAVPPDSVRLIWSNDALDQMTLSLAVTDSGLAGTEHLDTDVGDELDGGPPPDRTVFLPHVPCAAARAADR